MKRAFSRKNLWESVPTWMKSSMGHVLRFVPSPWVLGKDFRASHAFVRDAQWWSIEQAREYQLARLRGMLELSYERAPFYRRMFDAAGFHPRDCRSLDDIERLPTIDKRTVIENLADMCTRSIKGRDVDFGSTGGTSGTPLHFYLDAGRSSVEYAYLTCSWERGGYKLGMPTAVLRGRMVRPDRNGFLHEYDPMLRHHYYSNFHLNDGNMRLYLEHMRGLGPCVLHAYPSSAHAFARFILTSGERVPQNIRGILLESENVYADQLDDMENAFGARAVSAYGHSEKLVLAVQCEYSRNYHVWPTYGYFELVDPKGDPVRQAGQEGEIVGTGFINTVVPFIRYRTGDHATYIGEGCEECGREHVIIGGVKGRWPQGWLIAADGSVVSMTTLNVHDDTLKSVREYQFHQSMPGKATLCIVPTTILDDSEQNWILANMNERLQGQVILNLEIRQELVKTARGKQPRVIQKCASPVRGI